MLKKPSKGIGYERHRPEQTLLCQIIDQYYPEFLNQLENQVAKKHHWVKNDAFIAHR